MSFLINRYSLSLVSLLLLGGAVCGYVKTGGVATIEENSVGLVTSLDGSHSKNLLQPGTHLATPFWQAIKVIPVTEATHTSGVLKAQTREVLPVSVILTVSYTRVKDADALAAAIKETGSNPFSQSLDRALAQSFADFGKGTTSLSYVPVEAVQLETAEALKAHLSADAKLKALAVQVETVTIKQSWLTPELQVPIDAARQADQIFRGLAEEAQKKACEGNPNCN